MATKKLPTFKNQAEERAFWQTHDSTDYVDWSKAKRVIFPKLKPSSVTISLRLPKILLEKIRHIANQIDVPYQSYIKTILSDKVHNAEASVPPSHTHGRAHGVVRYCRKIGRSKRNESR